MTVLQQISVGLRFSRFARRIARAENRAVFHGWESAGFRGIAESCTHDAIALSGDFNAYTRHVAEAVETLLRNGIKGPYALALAPEQYTGVLQSTEHGGYPVLNHLHLILDGPVVWAPTIQGAVVVSLRGGDFEIHSGLDFSIRYLAHDRDHVDLELVETVTFRNLGPDAAIRIQ